MGRKSAVKDCVHELSCAIALLWNSRADFLNLDNR